MEQEYGTCSLKVKRNFFNVIFYARSVKDMAYKPEPTYYRVSFSPWDDFEKYKNYIIQGKKKNVIWILLKKNKHSKIQGKKKNVIWILLKKNKHSKILGKVEHLISN